MEAVETTGAGLSPRLKGSPESPQKTFKLTPRQIECLRWIAFGKTSAEIAILLGLSYRTVEGHIYKAFEILGVTTRPQAIAKALTLNLI